MASMIVMMCVIVLFVLVCMRKNRNRFRSVAALFSILGWLGVVLIGFCAVNYYLALELEDIALYLT